MSDQKEFPKERASEKANFPTPEAGETVYENPPTFIWNPIVGEDLYEVLIYSEDGTLAEALKSRHHFATPRKPLAPGNYFWEVRAECGAIREKQGFSISENALIFERPSARELWDGIPDVRPRHLFKNEDISELLRIRKTELSVLERNVNMALSHGFPKPPEFHRDDKAIPYRKYFGEFRDFCDRDLIAVSLKYALTGDTAAGEHGKKLLLKICQNALEDERYLTSAALFGKFGDEVGLSMARCLPSALDLLFPLLGNDELRTVAKTVYLYAVQCRDRLRAVEYIKNPSNSHVGRLPAYLGEAAVVLKGLGTAPDEELIGWLDEALEIYCGIFPYYGNTDGSWAEGAFYSTSYSKWYLPFFSLVERFTGKSLMNRPFYHRFTNYLIHFAHPDYEIHPFGDGYWCTPDSPEWPGFFAQNPFRIYADKFGPEYARVLSDRLSDQNYYSLHLLDLFLPAKSYSGQSLAHEPKNAEIFPAGGFAALHTDMYAKDDIAVLARASRFGSDSHRHADQGSFALFVGGKALISPSGYFGFQFGTKHHKQWTNSTMAHNTLLFNGEGQPCNSMQSRGKIISFDEEKRSVTLELSEAYGNIKKFKREIKLYDWGARITDTVCADEKVEVTYPLHTLSEPSVNESGNVTVTRGATLEICPVEGDLALVCITDRFGTELNDGVAEDCHVTMPAQYHITYKAPPRHEHKIVVDYKVMK